MYGEKNLFSGGFWHGEDLLRRGSCKLGMVEIFWVLKYMSELIEGYT